MKKTILAAVPLALLALAVPSAAQAKHATTYKANLAPTAGTALHGTARLDDGRRRDRVQVRLRGLEAGATYRWSLRTAPAGEDACGGDEVGAFSYADLRGRKGQAKSRSRGREFAGAGAAYAVVVSDDAGEDVACFELKSKAQRKADRQEAKQRHDAGDDDSRADDDDDERADDDDRSEDEPAEDGASDDSGDDLR